MCSLRWLVVGGVLLGFIAGFVAIASQSGAPGRADAISPTPMPWDVEWEIDVPEEAVAGSTVVVSAEAALIEPFLGPTVPARDPVYTLTAVGGGPALELVSAAEVAPADVSDGAAWELRALRAGEATIEVSLTYEQSWCYPCDTHYYTASTTRVVTVTPLPGDVDCDLEANSIDAALVLQLAAGMIGELPCADGADVSLDGSVDALDATLILQYAAGLLDTLAARPALTSSHYRPGPAAHAGRARRLSGRLPPAAS